MRSFEHKSTWRKILESKPILILLSIIILVFAWNVFRFWGKMRDTADNKKVAEMKVAQLEAQKLKLESDIKNLSTDRGKEQIFRENYGLAKEGEGEIVIVDDKSNDLPADTNKSGFLNFLKNLFK